MSEDSHILKSRAEVAELFRISEKTLRRHLAKIKGLDCTKIGRTIFFNKSDLDIIGSALRCHYPIANVESVGTFAEQSGSGKKYSLSRKNPQDAARKQMQKRLEMLMRTN